jgi:hypothetical protein
MRDDCLYMLNLMGKGYTSKEPFDDIVSLFLISSRGSSRNKTLAWDSFSNIYKSTNEGVTMEEIGKLFENFKTYILISLTTQLDVL